MRFRLTATRVGMAGLVVFVLGGTLLGTSMAASASGPTLSLSPSTIMSPTVVPLTLTGTGYPAKANGAAFVCPIVTGQPTVPVGSFGDWPVGCEGYTIQSKPDGDLKPGTVIALVSGKVIGPPATGTDSDGRSAAADAQNYPVPPYHDEGTSVEVFAVFGTSASDQASAPLSFTFSTPGATTTTTTTSSSTTAPCNAKSATANATKGHGTVTVNPATCLIGGSVVTVSATGLTANVAGSNALGTVIECNSDAGQPTISFAGNAIPVSCSAVLGDSFTPNAQGTYSGKFTIVAGVTGPPTEGTDSAGNSAANDAANYPCPPTPAQVSKGDHCDVAVGDLAGDEIPVPISFNTNKLVTTTTTAATTATTSSSGVTATTSSSTSATSSSLAFTGTGPGVWWLGLIGVLMMLLGALLLLLAGPRVVLARAVHTSSRVLRRRT